MTWIALDCDLFDHPKMVDLPNDSARYGWIVTLSKAKRQRNAGSFASAKHFTHVLGKYGRFVNDYVRAGLLERADDGTLTIHDWRKHQWASSQARRREEDGDETSRGPNVDIEETSSGPSEDSRGRSAVPVPVSVVSSSSTEEGSGGKPPRADVLRLQKLAEALTNRPYVMANPHGGLALKAVTEQLDLHGYPEVERVWRQVAADHGGKVTFRQLVIDADNILNPLTPTRAPSIKDEKAAFLEKVRNA